MSEPTETTIEPREFEFSWMENGSRQMRKITAESYPLACFKLGVLHSQRFKDRWPKDFLVVLDDKVIAGDAR